jgi:glyoxylase-like metal-dependent hydrolase (beta-lactamase superfamily II)
MNGATIRPIDVRHRGHERVICSWLVGDVLIDCGPGSTFETLVEELGDVRPRILALTHIHLDHAGAAGLLADHFPDLEVWVHEVGAPHMIDPSRLMASATRLYGDQMDALWGEMRPVPADRVRELRGGEQLGSLEVAYTPGHASHHVSYWHEPTRTAFTGDVAGVRIAPADYVLAPTPPPDIDLEAWYASIDRLREWHPEHIAVTHFGRFDDAPAHLDAIQRSLEVAARRAQEMTVEEYVAATASEIAAACDGDTGTAYSLGAPLDQTYAGLARYWRKRAESAA